MTRRSITRRLLLLALLSGSAVVACRSTDADALLAAAVRTAATSGLLAKGAVRDDVLAFYATRSDRPAWVGNDGETSRADIVLAELNSASTHGLDADYGALEIERTISSTNDREGPLAGRAAAIADLDVRITTALLTLGRDVALGRTSPSSIDTRWKAKRTPPDFAALLAAVAEGDEDDWLEQLQPQHPEYGRLRHALEALQGQRVKGGWPAVAPKALAPGARNSDVTTLRARLASSGHLPGAPAAGATLYDQDVAAAVKAFQEHHTLKASGTADIATIAAMNVPIESRIEQVRLNMERWRWMPDEFGDRHLFVNIPSYHVIAREQGQDVMDIRVVVGTPEHSTPIFSDEMSTVVFSPYWNIPDTIAEGETVPALMRDSRYLDRNNIEVLRATKQGTEHVDPKDVDWDDEGEFKSLMFRQKPGPGNALGNVKFLFPNDYDVYLHDTPADALFSRTGRAFSHGCVRVEEPETLAKYVLRDNAEWTEPRILEAMHAGVEKHVPLRTTIPVHIVYFTATVDENGGLHLLNDVYGYDARQRDARPRR